MKAQGRVRWGERVPISELPLCQIDRVTYNRVPQIPQMHTNLIRPSRARHGFEQRFPIRKPMQHTECRLGCITILFINDPKAMLSRLGGDWLA